MKISELGGEAALIRLIRDRYGESSGGDLALGIGDDAALIESGDGFLIVTADILIENTHFRMDLIDPELLGWKSVAANISDVAAMGGKPTYCFISIGLPDIEVDIVEGIYRGVCDCSRQYGSSIAGGDTVGSDAGIVINVTQLGVVERTLAARRDGAKPGDSILVTNTLGDSRAGLELLLKHGLDGAREVGSHLVKSHLKPMPRVSEARAAVGTGSVRSMMDLSDGLASDLAKLCDASGVGARVFASELPMSEDLRAGADILKRDAIELAAGGGEDYELLLTCPAPDAALVTQAIGSTGSKATTIGEITDGGAVVLISDDGTQSPMPAGWQHF